jgi:hypothetical protein
LGWMTLGGVPSNVARQSATDDISEPQHTYMVILVI